MNSDFEFFIALPIEELKFSFPNKKKISIIQNIPTQPTMAHYVQNCLLFLPHCIWLFVSAHQVIGQKNKTENTQNMNFLSRICEHVTLYSILSENEHLYRDEINLD